jgi:hypothetical protein
VIYWLKNRACMESARSGDFNRLNDRSRYHAGIFE